MTINNLKSKIQNHDACIAVIGLGYVGLPLSIRFSEVGFNTDRIYFVDNTKNTIENLRKITDLNISNKSNILITSAFHMKRALIISRKFKLDLIPYAVDFRSIKNDNLLNYYQTFKISDNLFKFDLFIRELLGIISFKILM